MKKESNQSKKAVAPTNEQLQNQIEELSARLDKLTKPSIPAIPPAEKAVSPQVKKVPVQSDKDILREISDLLDYYRGLQKLVPPSFPSQNQRCGYCGVTIFPNQLHTCNGTWPGLTFGTGGNYRFTHYNWFSDDDEEDKSKGLE